MLLEELKNIKSEKRDLRNFGLLVGGILAVIGGVLIWRGKPSYPYFLITGLLLVGSGLLVPSVLRPLQRAWMALAVVLGWVMTRVILSVLFYLVITPLSLLLRVFGMRFLDKGKSKGSYWQYRKDKDKDVSRYERQF
jgi:NADH:ubiquinone oxidoreductase subunit 5 (subunit L)/multisubunit Na+/H+ antiporter MnhA subunit